MTDAFDQDGNSPEAAGHAVGVLKTLSHVGRLRILCSLIDRNMNVGELCEALDERQASVSQQLTRLRAEGFVSPSRDGKHMVYAIARPEIVPIIQALRSAYCDRRA